jgi:hypothetical protein
MNLTLLHILIVLIVLKIEKLFRLKSLSLEWEI